MAKQPLRHAVVGQQVRLLGDRDVRLNHFNYQCNRNEDLGLPFDQTLTIVKVTKSNRFTLIQVKDNHRLLDMRRFYSVEQT